MPDSARKSTSGDSAVDRLVLSAGRAFFKYRDFMAPVAVLAVMLLTRPGRGTGSGEYDAVMAVLGTLIASAGQALRGLVIGLAYVLRAGTNRRIAADRLVCEGVFAHVRNPLYLGNFLIVLGLTVVWNSTWIYLTAIPFCIAAHYSLILAEEDYLRGKFGQAYVDYCSRVHRIVPELSGFRATLAKFDFDWRRVVRKDYGTVFAWVSIVIVLIATKETFREGVLDAEDLLAVAAAGWLTLFLLWGCARWMKKTGRLESHA
jgi:protein-S-isoprenylcysteine O-methyltransferase Ste14